MASISTSINGARLIQFVGKDKKRRTIRLGKVNQKTAESIKTRIEYILQAQIAGLPLDIETAQWVGQIGDKLADKMAKAGLIPQRVRSTLGDFLEEWFKRKGKLKDGSAINLHACRTRMINYFGADRDLRAITTADCEGWLTWLREQFASSTTARTFRRGKQFLQSAVKSKMLQENPFAGIRVPGSHDTSKQVFISVADTKKILDELPPGDLRLIFALARFAGLRVPSEIGVLRWEDVLWDKNRIKVSSPKTEHIEGREYRFTPIFPDLLPYLRAAFEAAPAGTVHVISRTYCHGGSTMVRPIFRAIIKAGLARWPKTFVNLRSSLETELVERFPLHVVTSWLGNTVKVAQKHYLQVTEEHFRRAAQGGDSAALGSATAPQNAERPVPAPSGQNRPDSPQPQPSGHFRPESAAPGRSGPESQLDFSGFSQAPCGDQDLRRLANLCAANSDLAMLLYRWECLTVETRSAIISLAREVAS